LNHQNLQEKFYYCIIVKLMQYNLTDKQFYLIFNVKLFNFILILMIWKLNAIIYLLIIYIIIYLMFKKCHVKPIYMIFVDKFSIFLTNL